VPYAVLTSQSIPAYLKAHAQLLEILGNPEELAVSEIGDGNLNYVYRISNARDPSKSLILKQSVPYLRILGEGFPLSKERIHFEIRAHSHYGRIAPERLPDIYHSDEEQCVLVMQDLGEHRVLRGGLIAAQRYPNVGSHIGNFLGKALFETSALGMQSRERRRLMSSFVENDELTKLSEDYIFTYPVIQHDSNYVNPETEAYANGSLRADSSYKLSTLRLKEKFLCSAEALIHGDLHTGSFMVNRSETYAIDWEFAFFGPMGFDLGKIMANFLMNCISHDQAPKPEYQSWLLDQAFQIWENFEAEFAARWQGMEESAAVTKGLFTPSERKAYLERCLVDVLRDTAGYCACSMTRRTLGIGGIPDIRGIADLEQRSRLEIKVLKLAQLLMSRHMQLNRFSELRSLLQAYFSGEA